ncbi:MAG: VOC family protein [Kiloniellaceae bacterium]|nr:VOC family protein [Kiloniellaceae bacterium]
MGVLDHIGFAVTDLARSKAFYKKALAPLEMKPLFEVTVEMTGGEAHCGFGRDRPQLWIGTGRPLQGVLHIAFTAQSRAVVDAFHQAALAAGGRDNGKPGLRPQYHANYYGAFVLDPDGHNVEAVCHLPE